MNSSELDQSAPGLRDVPGELVRGHQERESRTYRPRNSEWSMVITSGKTNSKRQCIGNVKDYCEDERVKVSGNEAAPEDRSIKGGVHVSARALLGSCPSDERRRGSVEDSCLETEPQVKIFQSRRHSTAPERLQELKIGIFACRCGLQGRE